MYNRLFPPAISLMSSKNHSVIVGLSGGVDSAVAAHLLIEQGYQVTGLFMKNWEEDDGTEYCTALEDLADAERVAQHLGIDLQIANFAAEYWDNVFEDFLQEYSAGNTPNPDVLCNREIKFKQFLDYASLLGGDFIATGHYARWTSDGRIAKGKDANKDQTYFLQQVPGARLNRCLFPLGDYKKSEVRALADQIGLHNAERKDSTGICFIGERRFSDFIDRYITGETGPIADLQGRRLGTHAGLHHYTVGQRQGINLGGLKGRPELPWYVAGKNLATNALYVTQYEEDLQGSWLLAENLNWVDNQPLNFPFKCAAKIRYRQKDQPCEVHSAGNGRIRVRFEEPQRAIARGQYVALYDGEVMLGGGRITQSETRPGTEVL